MKYFLDKVFEEFQTPFQSSVLIFSVILFIILLAPIILRRFNIPGIIGLIISGILVGPHGFYLIEDNSAVDLFSTIGLLYIMFLAGLELDLKEFSKNKYKSLAFGFLTFIFPISLGFPVCMYLLGYGFSTSLLTASMFATHTLVAYPIVSKLGISRNEAVAIAVGGTILTDTAVLLILAFIKGSAEGGLTPQLWARLGISIAVFLVIVLFLIPAFARWFFRRWEDEKSAHYIFILSMVFFSAFVAELAGLESIIGAFAAGLTLNRLIPHTSPLMNRIEFVGNTLFIPFFLISVGMLIDVSVIVQGPQAIIVALTLTVVALAGKWIAAFLTALIFRYTAAQRNLIFGLSSAHAAATLAVILVGFRMGIIDEAILNGTIILILVTCLVASFVAENAGKKVALQEEKVEQVELSRVDERILVPISNSATMDRLIDLAFVIRSTKSMMPVYGLSVVEDNDKAQVRLAEVKKLHTKIIQHAVSADKVVKTLSTIDKNISKGIKRVAKEISATDIVIGNSNKSGIESLLYGKHVDNIINATTQSVLVCNLPSPLNILKNIRVICPPHSEKEYGFSSWLTKVVRLSGILSLKVFIYTSISTSEAIKEFLKENKLDLAYEFVLFANWDDYLILSRDFQNNDLIINILPRRGNVSYMTSLDVIPIKMSKYFLSMAYINLYPEVRPSNDVNEYSDDYDPMLLEKGIKQVRKGVSGITSIFKKDNEDE